MAARGAACGGTSTPIAGGNPALWSRTPIGPRPAGGCPTPCRRVRPPPAPGWLGAACTHPADVGEGFDRRGRKAAGLPPAPCLSLPPVQGAQLPNEHPLSHPHFYFDLISRDSAAERGPKSHREGRGGGGRNAVPEQQPVPQRGHGTADPNGRRHRGGHARPHGMSPALCKRSPATTFPARFAGRVIINLLTSCTMH